MTNPLPLCASVFGSCSGIPGPAVTHWKTGGDGSDPPLDTLFEAQAAAPAVPLPVPRGGGRSRPIYPCGKARIQAKAGGRRGGSGPAGWS